jgi:carboxyl-terminal processing protease
MLKFFPHVTLIIPFFFACTQIPVGMDSLFTKRYSDNMQFCWEALTVFSIFQDKVPTSTSGYYSVKDLYKSIGDKWTVYYTTDTARLFLSYLNTSNAGIGILIDSIGYGILIKTVFPRSPGERAGLRDNDTIVAINGASLAGLSFNARLEMLSGMNGQVLRLTVHRGSQELVISVTLGDYMAPSVFADSLDSLTAYLAITEFSDSTIMKGGTSEEFDSALDQTKWARYTILDLRSNGGGYVDESIDVSGQFVPPSTPIAISRQRIYDPNRAPNGLTTDSLWATIRIDGKALKRNVFVLVDGYTASASELVITCLRIHRPDIMSIGTNTYGKARGQYVFFPTPDSGLAKVTFSLLKPVDNVSYDEIGITPNRLVSTGEDALAVAQDIIRQKEGLPTLSKQRQNAVRSDQERIRRLRSQMQKPFFEPLGVFKCDERMR